MKNIMTNRIGSYDIYNDYELGHGSYSTVYMGKCIDTKLISLHNITDGLVAIKKILKQKMSKKVLQLLYHEIDIMRLISVNPHPNIVKCYDIIEENNIVYFIIEYCDSGEFGKLLGKPIKEHYARYYFSQLINGLQHLDNNNIMHRDIKPSNILLTNNKKTLKICDFGFAKKKGLIPRITTMCGSPLYMAPEIFEHNGYESNADIWSIGIILFEIIYGYHPFGKCVNLDELTDFLEHNDIMIPPKNITNFVSNKCLKLLQSLLQKDSSKRITWTDLFNDLWITHEIDTDKEQNKENNTDTNVAFSFKSVNIGVQEMTNFEIDANGKEDSNMKEDIDNEYSTNNSTNNSNDNLDQCTPFFLEDF
jgi:serine/threonine protein kinase